MPLLSQFWFFFVWHVPHCSMDTCISYKLVWPPGAFTAPTYSTSALRLETYSHSINYQLCIAVRLFSPTWLLHLFTLSASVATQFLPLQKLVHTACCAALQVPSMCWPVPWSVIQAYSGQPSPSHPSCSFWLPTFQHWSPPFRSNIHTVTNPVSWMDRQSWHYLLVLNCQ